MRVAYVTAGAAGMFCGSCMRDNTLARTLRRQGVDVTLLPTFTPIRTDEEDTSIDRVFLGGINIYLEQRSALWRRLPRGAKSWLDSSGVLRAIAPLALATRREYDSALAVSLLRGEHGHQKQEIEQLVSWLADDLRPDLVHVSNLLIAGFVRPLRRRLDVPVVVTLQGDDLFLDSLPEIERAALLRELRVVAREVDGFVVMSDYYRDYMAELLDVASTRFHRVRLGIDSPEDFAALAQPTAAATDDRRPPTLGYLARICPEKGFHLLVDAFLQLRSMQGMAGARLRFGGWLGGGDRAFFETQLRKLEAVAGKSAFDHVPLPDRESKIRFLHGIDVLSVPTLYREPKGLFVLEALAAGVPVVLPAHGCFPELVRQTGGARLVPPNDPVRLAEAIHVLLEDPVERRRLGDEGRVRVCTHHTADAAARDTTEVWERMLAPLPPAVGAELASAHSGKRQAAPLRLKPQRPSSSAGLEATR
jgi:glycosyltransferase involved in cell wall biosynthesis